MNKTIGVTAVFLGVLAIVLGAFGAHGLREVLRPEQLESFQTGVRYQMYHALLLLYLGLIPNLSYRYKKQLFILILLGLICFSFSIYLLSTRDLTGLDISAFGLITPFGGVLLISAWILLGYRIFRQFD